MDKPTPEGFVQDAIERLGRLLAECADARATFRDRSRYIPQYRRHLAELKAWAAAGGQAPRPLPPPLHRELADELGECLPNAYFQIRRGAIHIDGTATADQLRRAAELLDELDALYKLAAKDAGLYGSCLPYDVFILFKATIESLLAHVRALERDAALAQEDGK